MTDPRLDRRSKIRANLSALYLPHYDMLCDLLPDEWQPYDGFRSFEDQNALFQQGRKVPGEIVTNAPGGASPHNYGCASDWTIWKENKTPLWIPADDPRWAIYIDAIQKVGLRPGSEFKDYHHNELRLRVSWKVIYSSYQEGGLQLAHRVITDNREPIYA